MISKWFNLKDKAKSLRKSGLSIRDVENKLGIPRSTLSGWFKDIDLTKTQKKLLYNKWKIALKSARKKAVIWHNQQKANRLLIAENKAILTLSELDIRNKNVLELALSFLYMGEGAKTNVTSMGNSNPLILRFFISSLHQLYGIGRKDLRCNIYIRSDQNRDKVKRYWSKELKIPITNFGACLVDKRPIKSKTYSYYKGVCVIRAGGVSIQRKLVFLSNRYCDKIIDMDD